MKQSNFTLGNWMTGSFSKGNEKKIKDIIPKRCF